jgi:hypothetical protein
MTMGGDDASSFFYVAILAAVVGEAAPFMDVPLCFSFLFYLQGHFFAAW